MEYIDDTEYKEFLKKCTLNEVDRSNRYEVFFFCSDCDTTFSIISPQVITALFRAEENKCPKCGKVKNIKLTGHKDLGNIEDVLRGEIEEVRSIGEESFEERSYYRETTYKDILIWAAIGNLYY